MSIPIPVSADDESNPYDPQENDISRALRSQDQVPGGSRKVVEDLGLAKDNGKLLPTTSHVRRSAIERHTTRIEERQTEIERIRKAIDSVSDGNEQIIEELAAKKTQHDLEKYREQGSEAALKVLCLKVEAILRQKPYIATHLQSSGVVDLGIPTLSDIEEAIKAIENALLTKAVTHDKLVETEQELNRLQEKLRAQEQAFQGSTESSLRDSERINILAKLTGADFGDINSWPMAEIEGALAMAKTLETLTITPNAQRWMDDLQMTTPIQTGRSAREQAIWLFSEVSKQELGFSLADIHAFVVAMNNAQPSAILTSLAFFHYYILGLVSMMKQETLGCKIHSILIFLRSLELILLYLSEEVSGYRIKALSLYQEVAPLVEKVAKDSKLIRGLTAYVAVLLTGNKNYRLAGFLTQEPNTLVLDGKQLMSDGNDLILIERDQVHVIRDDKHNIELDAISGFRFVVCDYPEIGAVWRSTWLALTVNNADMLERDFNNATDRLCKGKKVLTLDARLASFHIGFTG